MSGKLFLGLDCSTQAIKLSIIGEDLKEMDEFNSISTVSFESLSQEDGPFLLRGKSGELSVTTPTRLWLRALDKLLENLSEKNFPFDKIVAISGSGQQHGSVYWANGIENQLENLNSEKSLYEESLNWFSINQSPIWMDSSTHSQCLDLENLLGREELATSTGSTAYERFTINQIKKIAQENPQSLKNTREISLVSSFLASVFVGKLVPIDYADASGMNLMDLQSKKWNPKILQWASPKEEKESFISDRLMQPILAHSVVGNVSNYFVKKFGFSNECKVIAFSGDNPCSLAGVGLTLPEGEVAVSLGTSDTVFGPLLHPHPSDEGHVFASPIVPEGYMAIVVYKNGSLTRQWIRDEYADSNWDKFDEILKNSKVGNDGKIGFYFKEAEITPHAPPSIHKFDSEGNSVNEFPNLVDNVRAIVEGQFLSMYLHCSQIGLVGIKRILVTGGASRNNQILQILSNVFGAEVVSNTQPNSACLGAAYRALHGFICEENKSFVPFDRVVSDVVHSRNTITPDNQAHAVYQSMLERYETLEKKIISKK